MKVVDELNRVAQGLSDMPHEVLGMHPVSGGILVRTLQPGVVACEVVDCGTAKVHPMKRNRGFFESRILQDGPFPYRLRVKGRDGRILEIEDPYRFSATVNQEELSSFMDKGDPWIYNKMGPRPLEVEGVQGWSFSVWSPRARAVSLVHFPKFDPAVMHPMRRIGSTGVWEIFLPEIALGSKYKFHVRTVEGEILEKADPMALFSEGPPHNASIVYDLRGFSWKDQDWMERRNRDWGEAPMSVYEVHPGSWRRPGTSYRELAIELGDYVQETGFTHVEFMPLNEHPFVESWGYQVTGYYGPNHRFGNPHDLMHLVDEFHNRGIGVIIDWVPAHFPKDAFGLGCFDGGHLYEYEEEWKREHRDWGTWVFDYGKPQVCSFLMGSAIAWLDRYHVDGLRVDAVASMLYLDYSRGNDWEPNKLGGNENLEAIQFLQQVNAAVRKYFPGTITIAEESTAYPNVTPAQPGESLGFHFKWNLGWMHDVLQFFQAPPSRRCDFHDQLIHCRDYHFAEDFIQVFSHDEVVHEKKPLLLKMAAGDDLATKAADLRTLFVLLWGWPGKKTLFMGGEFGQLREWSATGILQWELLEDDLHQGLWELIHDLNQIYVQDSSLARTDPQPHAFQWLDSRDSEHSTLSFLRWGYADGEVYLFAFNFGPEECCRTFGVPNPGVWTPLLHSSAPRYGGTLGRLPESRIAQDEKAHGQPHSINLDLPAFSAQVWRSFTQEE